MENTWYRNMIDAIKSAFVSRRVGRSAVTYYFSYFNNTGHGVGVGGINVIIKNGVVTADDIKAISKDIKDKFGYNEVVIINWRRFA